MLAPNSLCYTDIDMYTNTVIQTPIDIHTYLCIITRYSVSLSVCLSVCLRSAFLEIQHMGIANIGSETDKCRLSLSWTNAYQPGSTNSLVYTLATNMGIIVACNGGGFGFFGDGGLVVDSGRGVTGGGGMFWAAPAEGSGDVRCRALCGNQDGMWVAPELTITEASEITTNTQHLGTITRQLV